jgi:hypothetical protein
MPKRRLISFDWAMKKLLRSKTNFEILEETEAVRKALP